MVSPEAMRLLTSYDYPGNVRELENILARALVLGGDVILPEHLPEAVRQGPQAKASGSASTQIIIDENIEFPVDLDDLLQTVERSYLEAALKQASGVKKRAAGMLGINFRSFRYRLQKFGID